MEDTKDIEKRVAKVEVDLLENKLELSSKIEQEMERLNKFRENSCPLEPYKNKISDKFEKFSMRIDNLQELIEHVRDEMDKGLEVNKGQSINSEQKMSKSLSKITNIILMLGICLVGVIGTIQTVKVSQSEFNNFIREYSEDKEQTQKFFTEVLTQFHDDAERREDKIDRMFEKQLDFNRDIIKQNALLQQQLEVIKVRLKTGSDDG